MRDYWSQCWTFGFCKRFLKSWYLRLEYKKFMFILHVFCDFPFFLKNLSIHFTWKCFKYLFHMNKHIYEIVLVTCVEESSRWNGRWRNIGKKAQTFFGSWLKTSRFQAYFPIWKSKVHQSVTGFSNRAQRFTKPYYLDYRAVML